MSRIGLIGYGAIGRSVVERLNDAGRFSDIVGVLVRPDKFDAVAHDNLPAVGCIGDLLSKNPDIVAEVAGAAAVAEFGEAVLTAGSDFLVVSIGALVEDQLLERLRNAAKANGSHILLPAGAIGGVDAIAAMKLLELKRVTYRSRKAPAAWKGSIAESIVDLDDLTEPVVLYRGTAREAARLYPKNANVAATVALAGIGLDATLVELIADPSVSENIHEIEAEGSSGRIAIKLEGRPSPTNPRTSVLTSLSVTRSLLNMDATIGI
jgi:aspartate dehydrogenase